MEANINLLKIMFLTLPVSEKKWYLLPLMVGMLGTLAWWFSVNFSADDSQKYQELRQELCDSSKLNLEEILLLSKLLEKSEGLQITDLQELKDFFCGNCKGCIFPRGDKMIQKIFGINRREFHKKMKRKILSKAIQSSERVRKFCRRVQNPDIGYNPKTGRIGLKNAKNKTETIETNIYLDDI